MVTRLGENRPWAIVHFGQSFENHKSSPNFCAAFSEALVVPHVGRFFQQLV
jgi:hypothetical protein